MILNLKIVLFITVEGIYICLLLNNHLAKSFKLKTQQFWYDTNDMPVKISKNIEIYRCPSFFTWLSEIFTLISQ